MSVRDVLAESAGLTNAPALYDGMGTLGYGELDGLVSSRAVELRDEGLRPGEYHPLIVTPSRASVIELLAAWRASAVPVPVNPALTAPERDDIRRTLSGARPPTGTQVVLWTSGTSGQARGVALSWEAVEAVTRAVADRLDLSSDDRWLATLSPAHVGGLMVIVRAVLLGGSLIALGRTRLDSLSAMLDGGSPDRTGAERLMAPTRVSLVPTQLHRILEMRGDLPAPPALRSVLIGGAHAPVGLVERGLQLGWPLALTYGATEMSSQVATASPEVTRAVPGTVGAPLDCVEVRLAGDNEILLRGTSMGLVRIGERTEPIADRDGWYRTGDLGRLDEEGRLWITGRRADRIVTGGVTVEATEVEEALRAHPAVIDACVAGIPNEEWGELVGAWVEPVEGEFDLVTVEDDLRIRLADSKLPRVWHVAGGIPRNANEKVDRAAVRQCLQEAAAKAWRPA